MWSDFQTDFDPDVYVWENYGREILPEDQDIITNAIAYFKEIDALTSLEQVADIGTGPNFYPAMLLAVLLKPGGTIDLIEYAKSNRDFMGALLNEDNDLYQNAKEVRTRLSIGMHQLWEKFDAFIAEIGGDRFRDTFNQARIAARSVAGNIYELPEARYDFVSSYFVAESITTDRARCVQAFSSVINAAKSDSGFMIAVVIGSEGYSAGENTHFPAVNLSIDDVRLIFDSIDGIKYKLILMRDTDHKARPGYQGMALILGKRCCLSNDYSKRAEEA